MKLTGTIAIVLAALAVTATPAGALEIHAHRGGALAGEVPAAPENSLWAFKSARSRGADVVEMDVHVSSDHVPFIMHDATLDRTTDCTGNVPDHTAAQLDACHIDIVGTNDPFTQAPGATEPVPRLAAVLAWAKSSGTRLNVEINHYPNEPSFDATPDAVKDELDVIDASGIAKSKILIQSFFTPNIDAAKQRGYRTAIITFDFAEGSALQAAQTGGYQVLEPQWPLKNPKQFVKAAHAAGREVIPFTIDKVKDFRAARAAGVDGLITDDPSLASLTLRCDAARSAQTTAKKRVTAAKAALKHARTAAAKRKAAKRLGVAKRRAAAAARKRAKACAAAD